MPFNICRSILENIERVIVGKARPAELLLAALLAEGHVLLNDVPGVGKTLLAKSLARSIGGSLNVSSLRLTCYRRILQDSIYMIRKPASSGFRRDR